MNKYIYLLLGFLCGIIVSIIFKVICQCKTRRKNRQTITMMRHRREINNIEVLPKIHALSIPKIIEHNNTENNDNVSLDYTVSDDDDETKEDIHIRIAQNV